VSVRLDRISRDCNCPCEQLHVRPGQGDKDARARWGRSSRRNRRGSGQRVRGVEASRHVFHVEAELLDLIQPASQKAIDVLLSAEPCDRLVVRAEGEVRQDTGWVRGAAAQEVVAEYPQGVDHRQ